MNTNEFVDAVATEARLTKTQAREVIDAVFTAVTKGLVAGEKINVSGFGTFEVKDKPARMGINPSTGEKIEIDARKAVSFKPAKNLKELIKLICNHDRI